MFWVYSSVSLIGSSSHSSTLAWKIPWTEEPGGLQSMGSLARSRARLSDFPFTFHFHALEKEMATHSSVLCLENPRDGGAWWTAIYGVAQSRTQLMQLSSSRHPNQGANQEFDTWEREKLGWFLELSHSKSQPNLEQSNWTENTEPKLMLFTILSH